MKTVIKALLIFLFLLPVSQSSYAQKKQKKYSAEEVYAYFSQFTPQDVVDRAKIAVKFYHDVALKAEPLPQKEEENLFLKALKEFHSRYSDKDIAKHTLSFIFVPQRCDEGRVVAHYTSEFFKSARIKGFKKKYKDINGKKVGLILCQKVRQNPNGIWTTQYQWWPDTDEPLHMGFFLIPIPDTPYELQSFFPSKKYTEEELNAHFR